MADRSLDELADAVLDGERINWSSARDRLTTSQGRAVVDELRALSSVSVTRSMPRLRSAGSRRLPPVYEIARLLAIAETLLGIFGMLVVPTPAGTWTGLLVRSTLLATFAGTALYLDAGGRDRRSRALAGLYWTIAAAFSARGILLLMARYPAGTAMQAIQSIHAEAFLPAFMWLFAREFPRIEHFSRLDRASTQVGRLVLALCLLLFAVNALPSLRFPAPSALRPFIRLSGGGPWFWTVVFGCAIPALGVIAWRARRAARDEHSRVRLFLYGLVLSVGPVAIQVIGESLFPRFDALTSSPVGHIVGSLVVYPSLLLLPILTAYAVEAGDVLDVRVVVQRGFRPLLARWIILVVAVSTAMLLLTAIYRSRDRPVAVVLNSPQVRVLGAVEILALALLVYRTRLIRWLERWAVPETGDPSIVLAQMAERLKHTRTPHEIAAAIGAAAARALQTQTRVLLMEGGRLWPGRADQTAPPADSLIPVLVAGARGPSVVDERHRHSYYALLTEDDRAWIDDQRVAVIVPVLGGRGGGGLMAVICVEHRRTMVPFSPDDLKFLAAAAAAGALASDALLADPDARLRSDDELASQCVRCGTVDRWTPDRGACACGGAWEMAALPRQLLQRFTIDRLIGAGGMGVVYRATDVRLGRPVAAKTLTRLDPEAGERLIVEARTMAGLSHPHIAVLYGAELWRGTPVLIIEYLAGGTLAALLKRGPVDRALTRTLVTQLAGALEHLHRTAIYHGDIKPSNIGFTSDGTPKYLDFGLSRAVRQSLGPSTDPAAGPAAPIAGTLAYMPPEVLEGAAPGPALDVWALCVVLYECLTGRHPFMSGPLTRSRIAAGLAAARVDPALPSNVREWFVDALSVDAALRPQSAAEIARAVAGLLSDERDRTTGGTGG